MSNPDASKDPFDALRRLVDDWERRIDGLANQVMGTDGFSRTLNQTQGLGLRVQQAVQDGMAFHLKNLNMPSRDDVLRVGAAVQALDARLARVESRLDRVLRRLEGSPPAPRSGPPRTRKPPSQRGEGSA